MRLFKYSKRVHAAGLLSLGSIRIGTLHDFRRSEHERGIADPTEGTKSVKALVTQHIETNDSDEKEAFRKFLGVTVHGTITAPPGLKLQSSQTSPDFFVLCLSSELSAAVQSQFDGVDACVEILNSDDFFEELTRVLNIFAPVTFEGFHRISYRERIETCDISRLTQLDDQGKGLHPALIKEPKYSPQKEVRAVWIPRQSGPIKPVNVFAPGIIQFCRDVTSEL